MEQEKREICPYDDKWYLLSDLPDGRPNPNTHAYGHRDLAAEEHLLADKTGLARSLSFGTPRSDSSEDTPASPGASNSLEQWKWRRSCLIVTPTARYMVINST